MRSVATIVCLLSGAAFASSITANVVDVSGAAVAGISVQLLSENARYEAVSGPGGDVNIEDVRPGTYQVLLVRGASFFSHPSIRVSDPQELAIQLKLKLPLETKTTAMVTGILRDPEDHPIPNARVDLIRGPGISIATATDGEGRFVFEDLSPGQYKLRTIAQGVVTYFPDATEEDKAQLLAVRDHTGVDFSLRPAPLVKISGKVVDESYNPVHDARVRLFPVVPAAEPLVDATLDSYFLIDSNPAHIGIEETEVQSNDQGEFVLRVRPGIWRIQADAGKLSGGTSVRIDNDCELIVAMTRRPVTGRLQWFATCVRGRLMCGSYTGPGILVPLRVHSAGFPSNAVAITRTDGSFEAPAAHEYESEFAALPPVADGRPVAGILAPRSESRKGSPLALSFTIRSDGGGDVLLDQDREVQRVVAGLGEAMSGSIRGHVTAGAGAAVILLPDDASRYGLLVPCELDGHFSATGLAPGNYTAAAIRGLTVENLRAFGLLAFVRKSSTKVTIRDGVTAELDLKIAEWPE